MAPRRAPTLRAHLLGQRLRGIREDAGLTLRDIAEYVQRDASTVSRIESGALPARVPEVLAYVERCGVDDERRRDGLKRLSQDVFQKGWWDGYAEDVDGWLIDHIWLESRARQIQVFETVTIPGLLQTHDYAEAVLRAADPTASSDILTQWVEIRMTRQCLLSQPEPVQLTAVLDEAVLRRRVGGTKVMIAQFEQLLERGHQPNVELLVVPAAIGAHASPAGAFELLRLPDSYPVFGIVQTPAGEIQLDEALVPRVEATYERLLAMALAGKEALAFITDLARDLR